MQPFRIGIDPQNANIDFNKLTELDNNFIPEDCLSSDLDQYLPADNSQTYHMYCQNYGKHHQEEESNNNQKNKRTFAETFVHGDGYEANNPPGTYVRYHELQPSSAVIKTERYSSGTNSTVFTYQPPVSLPSSSNYYTSGSQYLPSYQYFPQRPVISNTTANSYPLENNPPVDTWQHFPI